MHCTHMYPYSDNSEVQMKAGQMYKEHGDLNKALEHTEKALMLDKYFIVAMLNQADSFTKVCHTVHWSPWHLISIL